MLNKKTLVCAVGVDPLPSTKPQLGMDALSFPTCAAYTQPKPVNYHYSDLHPLTEGQRAWTLPAITNQDIWDKLKDKIPAPEVWGAEAHNPDYKCEAMPAHPVDMFPGGLDKRTRLPNATILRPDVEYYDYTKEPGRVPCTSNAVRHLLGQLLANPGANTRAVTPREKAFQATINRAVTNIQEMCTLAQKAFRLYSVPMDLNRAVFAEMYGITPTPQTFEYGPEPERVIGHQLNLWHSPLRRIIHSLAVGNKRFATNRMVLLENARRTGKEMMRANYRKYLDYVEDVPVAWWPIFQDGQASKTPTIKYFKVGNQNDF